MATKNKNKSSVILPKRALRIVKSMLADKTGKDLSPRDLEIGEVILSSLNSRGIKPVDWVNNKDGIRDKTAHRKRIKKDRDTEKRILKGMGDRPPIESSELEKLQMKELKGIGLREHGPGASAGAMESGRGAGIGNILRDPSGMEPGPQPKSYLKRKDAKGKITKRVAKVVPKGAGHEAEVFPKALRKEDKPARRGERSYTIKKGDTLVQLAKRKGTTLGGIRRANPDRFKDAKSLNIIKAGERITLPPDLGSKDPYDVKTVPVKSRKRKAKVTGIATALPKQRKLDISGPGSWPEAKKDVREDYPTRGTRPELQHHEPRYIKLPEWLGGGRIKTEVGDEDDEFVGMNKKGGRIKKSVKKAKAKTRKRAALRGHRAELRGG